ncbi:hypothetical protein ATCV1_z125L [Acanthocystis turfacea chlorella virus 1]|uniref:Uncharacterized protein z125L n=1 Tax=Chlorovirus heliozoae TaxID=322019 RepID=A7K885_9PHYC|nr:hypothetical protein ATCV1_z125L [Acanthocystis turfacea chlorella virus 1]ABT16259.1 hypothetical protein ATCV1_z125L [Acanthocystis turfacea chlorella virus 1]
MCREHGGHLVHERLEIRERHVKMFLEESETPLPLVAHIGAFERVHKAAEVLALLQELEGEFPGVAHADKNRCILGDVVYVCETV